MTTHNADVRPASEASPSAGTARKVKQARPGGPRFTKDQRRELERRGVTVEQIGELEWRLPDIGKKLGPPTKLHGVRSRLRKLEKLTAECVRIVNLETEAKSVRGDVGAVSEVIGHLGMAEVDVKRRVPKPDDGTWPDVLDFPTLARLARDLAASALGEVSTDPAQRRGRRDPARAVTLLLEALQVPQDAASQELARRIRPTYDAAGTNDFAVIAGVVFVAAGASGAVRHAIDAWHELRRKSLLTPQELSEIAQIVASRAKLS